MVEDVARRRLIRRNPLPGRRHGMPQDGKLTSNGRVFYVADMVAGGGR